MYEIVLIGIGATIVMDVWGLARKPLLGIAPPNYGLFGRWLAYMWRGQVRHKSIGSSDPIRTERVIGWVAHYLTGIAFAVLLIVAFGQSWIEEPTLGPALIVGVGTTAAPFLLMQPAMGAGIASSRTPRPAVARLQTLVTHVIFGLGLYAAAWVTRLTANLAA